RCAIVSEGSRRVERGWSAIGEIGDGLHRAVHPTRDGAIALWQERWTWGPAIAALFGWLCERPFRGVRYPDGTALRVSVHDGEGGALAATVDGHTVRVRGARCTCGTDAWVRRED